MSVLEEIKRYEDFNYEKFFNELSDDDVIRSINKENLNEIDLLTLLSPRAENFLEIMAQKAHIITKKHFGNTILLYTPIYIANHCVNKCAYCSFNIENDIKRRKLNLDEIDREGKAVSEKGFKHIILLTGEDPTTTPVEYIKDAIKVLKKYFTSITIEIYPLKEDEYKYLVENGVDSLTVYQEVYNKEKYKKVHLKGPKRNYEFRLNSPESGCKAGMRSVNIGALLGLYNWREEAFMTGIHGKYLQDKYPYVDVSFSFPRIRPHAGVFNDLVEVSDKNIVQAILAFRLMFRSSHINISTRESKEFRENLLPLGVTKMSASSSTEVGSHIDENSASTAQFEISDDRDEIEVKKDLLERGYQPIFKDWIDF